MLSIDTLQLLKRPLRLGRCIHEQKDGISILSGLSYAMHHPAV